MNATLPTIFVIMTFMMWNWWSVYLSGELKSASNRGRQLSIMFGALVWDVIVHRPRRRCSSSRSSATTSWSPSNTAGNAAYAHPDGALVPLHRVARRTTSRS